MHGKLIIITAPSGSGKTTIARHLVTQLPELEFSVSATTRKQRPGEVDGRDYHFLLPEEFKKRITNKEFIEYEEVYPGMFYGTLQSEVHRIWEHQRHVVFDVDVFGAKNLKDMYGPNALLMFIKLPDFDTLASRLRNRSTETDGQVQTRLEKAKLELEFEKYADAVVINDNLDEAKERAVKLVTEFLIS